MLKEIFEAGIKTNSARNPGKVCVVYTPKKDVYVAFIVDEETADMALHAAIVRNENNNGKRDYAGILKPGSFNAVRISLFTDRDDAVALAKEVGLSHEPIKVVLAKFQSKKFEIPAHSSGSKLEKALGNLFDGIDSLFTPSGNGQPKREP